MDLSVIIVSYNTKEKLQMCLQSVFSSISKYKFEVFVVDNASEDGSAELVRSRFPQAKLLRNKTNLGFAKANNQAIGQAAGRLVLLLNSDVEIMPDTFDKMIGFLDNYADVGVAGCRVERPDGTLDLACRRSFPKPLNSLYRLSGLSLVFPKSRFASYNLTYLPADDVLEVDSVMGAFLMIRKSVIEQIGKLDENFFMYGEDLDWCYRAKQFGYKVMYAPITKVIHYKGSSSRRLPEKALYEFYRSMDLFYAKHYRKKYNYMVWPVVKIGIWSVYCVKYIFNFFRKDKFISK